MPRPLAEVVTVRRGDFDGNRMVARLSTHRGADIHAIAVPQDWPSRTGPTWVYLLDQAGLTLIDSGAFGSFAELARGIADAGFDVGDVDRVVITHGHADHDGAVAQLVDESGAELWAHQLYAHLLPFDPWDMHTSASPVQEEARRIVGVDEVSRGSEGGRPYRHNSARAEYIRRRKALKVDHEIVEGDAIGELSFLHAPGHSPDEICATLDSVVFTGDHVLPEITPHPTVRVRYSDEVRQVLPEEYREEARFYGLATYLRSLRRILQLAPDTVVLPAHRLFSKGRFNLQPVSRAGDVIRHHARRLESVLRRIGSGPATLEEVTRGIFERRKLIGGNLYMALSEAVAHIELLEEAGDVEIAEDGWLRGTGSENYRQQVSG